MHRSADAGGWRALIVASIVALCGFGGGPPRGPDDAGGPALGDTVVYREELRASVYGAEPHGPVEFDESFTWILALSEGDDADHTLRYFVAAGSGSPEPARSVDVDPLYRHRPGFISEPPGILEVGVEWPHREVRSGSWRGRDHRIERTGTMRVVGDTLLDGVRHLVVEARLDVRLDASSGNGDDPRTSTGTSLTGLERGRWVITPEAMVVRGERAGELRGVAAELSMREPRESPVRRTWRSVVTRVSDDR